MKWAEISIQTTHEATEAVANIFHDLGVSGVVIEDPELINSYRRSGIWDYCGIPEADNTEVVTVKAYLPVDVSLQDKMRVFEERINSLVLHNLDKGRGAICWREVQEEDWASSWKTYFHPIEVGERIVIKPTWEKYEAVANKLIIEIDPGMAFGTGTHYTTAMCVKVLEEIIHPGDVVVDLGTGSGILAIAAAKLGAGAVEAVDLDSVAVNIAIENVKLNAVEHIVQVKTGDLLHGFNGKADIIVANIIADVIIKLLANVSDRLIDGGCLLASGIIIDRLSEVTEQVLAHQLIVEKVIEEGGWVAMVVRKGAK